MQYEYYSILAVHQTASDDEIKKAYRKKAMEVHPDRHGGDKAKEAEFKKLNEAYSVLSDPQKKAHYDRHGTMDNHGQGGGFGGGFQ
jgi:molecular chaperone DnaJ